MSLRIPTLALVALLSSGACAWASDIVVPPRNSPVYDGAGVLSDESQSHLRARCDEVLTGADAAIGVVTVKTLGDEPIEDYAVKLLTAWGLGAKGKDRSVLVLVAPTEHKLRIEVGYGLEGILPDGKVGRIRDEYMVPAFKEGDYDGGIVGAVDAIAAVIAEDAHITLSGEPAPTATRRHRRSHSSGGGTSSGECCIIAIIIAFIIISNILRASRRRVFPWLGGGWGGGGWGGWSGGSGGWSSGGGGGGDWGGFGGGSSGGGGASGSW